MDDKLIQEAVMRELDWDPKVDAAHIGVSVKNGAVTLTGHVSSYSEKLAAVKAAERVRRQGGGRRNQSQTAHFERAGRRRHRGGDSPRASVEHTRAGHRHGRGQKWDGHASRRSRVILRARRGRTRCATSKRSDRCNESHHGEAESQGLGNRATNQGGDRACGIARRTPDLGQHNEWDRPLARTCALAVREKGCGERRQGRSWSRRSRQRNRGYPVTETTTQIAIKARQTFAIAALLGAVVSVPMARAHEHHSVATTRVVVKAGKPAEFRFTLSRKVMPRGTIVF